MNIITRNQAKAYIESESYLKYPACGFYQDGDIWISFNFFFDPDGNVKEHLSEYDALKGLR